MIDKTVKELGFLQPDHKDQVVANLEQEIESQKDGRNEERFYWICLLTILFNILFLKECNNSALPIIVFFIELIILLSLAKRMGMENIYMFIEGIINRMSVK